MRKALGGMSGSMILLVVIAFFLPWVQVSCAGTSLIEQSGIQVVTGDVSLSEKIKELSEISGVKKKEGPVSNDEGGAAWWLGAVLLGSLAAGIGGFIAITGKRTGLIVAIGGGVASVVLVATMLMSFPLESEMQDAFDKKLKEGGGGSETAKQVATAKNIISVDFKYGLWITLIAVIAQTGCGIGLVVTKPVGRRQSNSAGPAGPKQPYGHQGKAPRPGGPRPGMRKMPAGGPPKPGSKRTALPGKPFKMPGKAEAEPVDEPEAEEYPETSAESAEMSAPVETAEQDIEFSAEPTEPVTASEQPALDNDIVESPTAPEPQPTAKPVSATTLAILELFLLAVGLEDNMLDGRKKRAVKGVTKAFGSDVAQKFDAMSLVLEEDSTAASRIQEFIDPVLSSSNPRAGSSIIRIVKFILKDSTGFSALAESFIQRLEDLISGGAQDATVMISSAELQQKLQAPPPAMHQAPPPPMHQAPPHPMHQAPPHPMHQAPPHPMHQAPPMPMHSPMHAPPPPQEHQPDQQYGQSQNQVSIPRHRKRKPRR